MVKRKRRVKTVADGPRSPIADRVVANVLNAKRRKVIDLDSWRKTRESADKIGSSLFPSDGLGEAPPEFVVYSATTNLVLGLFESVQDLSEFSRFRDRIARAEDEYMPSGPPMSPLTRSHFWHWAVYDLVMGDASESIGSVFHRIASVLEYGQVYVRALSSLVESRLGIYDVTRVEDDGVELREIGNGECCFAVCPSGYRGEPGEIWLARVLPPPIETLRRSVLVTTPYVMRDMQSAEWMAFFQRVLGPEFDGSKPGDHAYARLMKRGREPNDWNEYVFESYINHCDGAIFLTGLPDIPESRPHSRINRDRY